MEDLLQTAGHAPIMHFSITSRELSRNSAQPKVGPRGRAEGQQEPRCLHILNEWDAFKKAKIVLLLSGPTPSQNTLGVRLGHQGFSDLASLAAMSGVRYTFIQIGVKLALFIPKELSSKTTFIPQQFHPKPVSSKTTFIPKPLSPQNHFHPKTTFIPKPLSPQNHFHRKPFSSKPISSENHFHQKTTFIRKPLSSQTSPPPPSHPRHTHQQTPLDTHQHRPTHTPTHTNIHTHTHTNTDQHTHTHQHTTHTRTHQYTHTNTHPDTHTHTDQHTHTNTHPDTHTHRHTPTHTDTPQQTPTHTPTHNNTQQRTRHHHLTAFIPKPPPFREPPFGALPFGAPRFVSPPFGAPPFQGLGSHPSGPHLQGPTIRPLSPTTPTRTPLRRTAPSAGPPPHGPPPHGPPPAGPLLPPLRPNTWDEIGFGMKVVLDGIFTFGMKVVLDELVFYHERSPLHTTASGFTFCAAAVRASATPGFRPSAFHSFGFSKWMLMPTFVRNASSNDSYTAPTLSGVHTMQDVVNEGEQSFAFTQITLHLNQCSVLPDTEK